MGELKLYKALEETLGSEKAKEVTEAIVELVKDKKAELKTELKEELTKELATKYDLQLTEQSLRALIEQCRGELQAQIEQVRTEIEQVRGELREEIQKVKSELLKWLIVLFIGQATFIVGLVFTLIKLLKG
jgi:gas vesicle protein